MRGIIVAVLLFVLGLVGPSILDRFVKDVPEYWWRLSGVGLVLISILVAVLSDPVFQWIKRSQNYPGLSVIAIGISVGLLAASVWLFLVIGFPSSKSYLEAHPKTRTEPSRQPEFNIERSIAVGEGVIIPSPENEKKTLVLMQLLPPLEDEFPNRYVISGVMISFENTGTTEDRDVSFKVYLPGVRKIICSNELIQVVDGAYEGATYVNLLAQSLKPKDRCLCKVYFMQVISNIRTVTA